MLSYGNEVTRANNPLECAMDAYCQLDRTTEYVGRIALLRIHQRGVERQVRGLIFDGENCPTCSKPWSVTANSPQGPQIGRVTTAIYSPRLKRNISLSMIERNFWEPGQVVSVLSADGRHRSGAVSTLAFV